MIFWGMQVANLSQHCLSVFTMHTQQCQCSAKVAYPRLLIISCLLFQVSASSNDASAAPIIAGFSHEFGKTAQVWDGRNAVVVDARGRLQAVPSVTTRNMHTFSKAGKTKYWQVGLSRLPPFKCYQGMIIPLNSCYIYCIPIGLIICSIYYNDYSIFPTTVLHNDSLSGSSSSFEMQSVKVIWTFSKHGIAMEVPSMHICQRYI